MVAIIGITRYVKVRTESVKGGDDVLIQTPAGDFSIQAREPGSRILVDVPIYPGARRRGNSGGGAVFRWTSNQGGHDAGVTVAGQEMITNDSLDQVVDFYKSQLKTWVVASEGNGAVRLESSKGGLKRLVAISSKSDGTHIGVASIGEPASN